VRKLTGVEDHPDHPDPVLVTFFGKQRMFSYRQPLHCSTSFLCSHICTIQEFHTIKNHVIWCSGLSDPAHGCLKSRVHAAADIAYVPSLATVKLNCYGHHDHSEPSLTVANDGTHTLGHLKNTPIWGVSRPPLGMLSLKAGTLFRCS